jgi:hypothetical protein
MKILIVVILCLCILLVIPGTVAESLISFQQEIHPDSSDPGIQMIPAGTLNFPPGLGILTETEVLQPYWFPKSLLLPSKVDLMPVDPKMFSPGLIILGIDVFQSGVRVKGISFSDGIPLKIVTRSLTNFSVMTPGYALIADIAEQGDTLHDYKVDYSAEWTPLDLNLSEYQKPHIPGNWTTNTGQVNLTLRDMSSGMVQLVHGKFTDGRTLEGFLDGPIFYGSIISEDLSVNHTSNGVYEGQFTTIFDLNGSSFSGTKGLYKSDTDDGKFSGEKMVS